MVQDTKLQFNKLKKTIAIIDLLMNFVKNQDLKDKWDYTNNLFKDLDINLSKYETEPSDVLYNYIDNDFHMLNRMVNEFKEDIYPHFTAACFNLIDRLNYQDIFLMSKRIDESLQIYSLSHLIENIYILDLNKFKKLAQYLLSKDISDEYINPLTNVTAIYGLNKSTFLQAEQLLEKVVKTLDDESLQEEMLTYKMHAFVVLAGENNVH